MVAGPYPGDRVDRNAYPNFYAIFGAPWQEISPGSEGLVDLSAVLSQVEAGPSLAILRHIFPWDETEGVLTLALTSPSEVDVFVNGWKVMATRGDGGKWEIPVYPRKGLNEIFLMVTQVSQRWEFSAATSTPLPPRRIAHSAVSTAWETDPVFLTSESVVKDPIRDRLYVSSFDNEYTRRSEPSGFISLLSLDGEILDLKWMEGLHAPTGMDIWRDTLFVAEREHLLAIELATGSLAGRWPIPDPVFPNDLVIGEDGVIYISDTRTGDWSESRIYRFRDGGFDIFANEGISRANGLWIHDGWLLVGSSGDGLLKRVELETGRVEPIVSLGAGIIDGIRVDPQGNILVSLWEGQLFRVSPEGAVEELLDALPERWNTADFEYLPEENLLLIPTFVDNRVRAIRIER